MIQTNVAIDALSVYRAHGVEVEDTMPAEFDVLRFLSDYTAYARCTTCGLRCSPLARLSCSACAA